jgi:hypothetical protein
VLLLLLQPFLPCASHLSHECLLEAGVHACAHLQGAPPRGHAPLLRCCCDLALHTWEGCDHRGEPSGDMRGRGGFGWDRKEAWRRGLVPGGRWRRAP